MVAARSGLIALVSFGTEDYLGDVFYDSAKAATNRLALASPGTSRRTASPRSACRRASSPPSGRRISVRTGAPPRGRSTPAGRWQRSRPTRTSHPGRAVLHAGDLARIYGFTDADGTQPERFRVAP